MSEFTLDDAIMLIEAHGLRVVSKERIKNLSFHVAITKDPERKLSLNEDEILSIYTNNNKVEKSIMEQLRNSEAIKHSIDDQKMVKYHHWNLRVIV